MLSFASARSTCLRRFHVSFVPPEVEAPLPLAFELALALLLALLLLLLGPAMASGAEMPRPFTLFKSGCALADRSSPDVFAIELALAPK